MGTVATTLLSIGGYYQCNMTATRHTTGLIRIPAAAMTWGTIMTLLSMMIQIVPRKPTKPMIGSLMIVVGLTAAGTALTAVGAAYEADSIDETIMAKLPGLMASYGTISEIDDEIDAIQTTFKCCGVGNTAIYKEAGNLLHGAVPESCCMAENPDCGSPPTTNNIHKNGCADIMSDVLATGLRNLATTLAVAATLVATVAMTLMGYWINYL